MARRRLSENRVNVCLFQGSDSFTLDVSNGFSSVEDLTVKVDIMPRFIPIQASNFSIKEGLSRVINEEILNISNHFYSLVNIDFSVEELPQHGEIRNLEGDELSYFTWDDVSIPTYLFYALLLEIIQTETARFVY